MSHQYSCTVTLNTITGAVTIEIPGLQHKETLQPPPQDKPWSVHWQFTRAEIALQNAGWYVCVDPVFDSNTPGRFGYTTKHYLVSR